MKRDLSIVVVYDSIFGNTKRIADRITKELRKSCRVIVGSIHHEIEPNDLPEIDLIIIGSPTHTHRPTHEMSLFLDKLSTKTKLVKYAALFDTRYYMHIWLSGSAAKKMNRKLDKIGIKTICKPESFFVSKWEGPLKYNELKHAVIWANQLLQLLQQQTMEKE